uniref:Uncharacterized protein n=1 Tax=Arundo donax TaxID=35708 RepID=A0A0A9DP35_ARUDO
MNSGKFFISNRSKLSNKSNNNILVCKQRCTSKEHKLQTSRTQDKYIYYTEK